MELVLVASGIIAGVAGMYFGGGWMIDRQRKMCPACRARKLNTIGHTSVRGRPGQPGYLMSYMCEACGAEFRQWSDGGMVSLEAWDAGVREPLPVAIVRSSREGS